jgi:hypothetical protein
MAVGEWLSNNVGVVVQIGGALFGAVQFLILGYVKIWLKNHEMTNDKRYHPIMTAETFRDSVRDAMDGQYVTRDEHHTVTNKITETNLLVAQMRVELGSLASSVETMSAESRKTNDFLSAIHVNVACLNSVWQTAYEFKHGEKPSYTPPKLPGGL